MVRVLDSTNTPLPTREAPCRHLHGVELRGHAFHGVVELLNARDRVDLRHLTGHLGVVHGVHGVLVVQLCDQQFEKTVLRRRCICGVGAAGAERCAAVEEETLEIMVVFQLIDPSAAS